MAAVFGYTVLSHITSILFLPAFLILLWQRPRAWMKPALFTFALFITGILPLAIHNASLTGSALRSTYTGVDTATPSLSVLPDNLAYYTTGLGSTSSPSSHAIAPHRVLISSSPPRLKSARCPLLAGATPLSKLSPPPSPAFLLIPTALLPHPTPMATDYYQYLQRSSPTLFALTFRLSPRSKLPDSRLRPRAGQWTLQPRNLPNPH